MCVTSPVGCAQGRDLVVFCSAARGRWWMLSLSCHSPQRKSQCTRWSAPTQPVRSRSTESSSRHASGSAPSRRSFKVGSAVLPEVLPTNPAMGRISHPSSLAFLPAQVACLPTSATPCSWMAIGRGAEGYSQEEAMSSVETPLSPQINPVWTSTSTSRLGGVLGSWGGLTAVRSSEGVALSPSSCDK